MITKVRRDGREARENEEREKREARENEEREKREARGNEEREKREDEKGSHCFFKSAGYDKLELKHQNLVFF